MKNDNKYFWPKLGIKVPRILLPDKSVDLTKWAVVACDQYSSNPKYWQKLAEYIEDMPSALNIILPEAFLKEPDQEDRAKKIQKTMKKYLEEGILVEQSPGFIYVERKISNGKVRKGLILALDLECFDYGRKSRTLIRPTEGTIIERIPPRIKIRQKAEIESPHIMVLIDDEQKTIIGPLSCKKDKFKKLYDFPLTMKNQKIEGFKIEQKEDLLEIKQAFENLFDGKLLFAMGDGNHSLATAKACWEKIKSRLTEKELENHSARFALVEVVNLYDESMDFEAINRVIFNVEEKEILDFLINFFKAKAERVEIEASLGADDFAKEILILKSAEEIHIIPFITQKTKGIIKIYKPHFVLEVESLQQALDEFLRKNKKVGIDYVHGTKAVIELGKKKNNIGFFLPAIAKHGLFKSIRQDGPLPRKSFSIGHAEDKRFYLECKKIK